MAKTKRKQAKPYTKEEIKRIMNTPLLRIRDLALLLGRSYDSVRRKKWALNNKDKDFATKKAYREDRNKEINDGKRGYNYWTKAEEKEILESRLPDFDLAQKMQRTIGAIQVKRNRLLKEKANGRNK